MSDLIHRHLHPETFSGPDPTEVQLLVDQVWQEFIDAHYDQGQAWAFQLALMSKFAQDVQYTSRDLFSQFTKSLKILTANGKLPL